MTEREAEVLLGEILELYDQSREIQQAIAERREKYDKFSGKETLRIGDFLGEYHDRIEDYVRGASATALKAEAPDLFAKYGKTSKTRTLRVYRVNE